MVLAGRLGGPGAVRRAIRGSATSFCRRQLPTEAFDPVHVGQEKQ